jgi:putative transposase
MDWKHLLAYITGSVDQELLRRNGYLVTENRILHQQIKGRVRMTDTERKTLTEMGKTLGKQGLEEVATVVKPETILRWHRKLIAQKFDGSQMHQLAGRPVVDEEIEALILRFARENRTWGYDRIVGALAPLGIHGQRPNRRQHPEASQRSPGTGAQKDDHLERVHPLTHGCTRRDGFLHR